MFQSFNQINNNNTKFMNGLVFDVAQQEGKLKVTTTPSVSGKIIFYKSNTGSSSWDGRKSDYSSNSKYNCTANVEYSEEFEVEKGDLIFVVYLPNSKGYLKNCFSSLTAFS